MKGLILPRPKRHLVAIVVKPTDLPTQVMECLSTTYCIPPLHTAQAAEQMNPTAVSLHLSTFLTHTAPRQQPKLTHACTTPDAQHPNCRCLSLMSSQPDRLHTQALKMPLQSHSANISQCTKVLSKYRKGEQERCNHM